MLTIREARQAASRYQFELRRGGCPSDPDTWVTCPLEDGYDRRNEQTHESIEDAMIAMHRARNGRRMDVC